MKTARLSLWISMSSDRGQRSRPCVVEYQINSIGAPCLYGVVSIIDARTKESYDVDTTLRLNGDMDRMIAAADPKQVEFAKKELGVDLKKPAKKKPLKKPESKNDDTFEFPF